MDTDGEGWARSDAPISEGGTLDDGVLSSNAVIPEKSNGEGLGSMEISLRLVRKAMRSVEEGVGCSGAVATEGIDGDAAR